VNPYDVLQRTWIILDDKGTSEAAVHMPRPTQSLSFIMSHIVFSIDSHDVYICYKLCTWHITKGYCRSADGPASCATCCSLQSGIMISCCNLRRNWLTRNILMLMSLRLYLSLSVAVFKKQYMQSLCWCRYNHSHNLPSQLHLRCALALVSRQDCQPWAISLQ